MYTVNDLLKKAMAVMGETERYKSGYAPFLVDLTNQLLMECFDANNAAREGKGIAPLEEIPQVMKAEGELEYEPEVVVNVMAYGLAFWLLFQDDENDKANICAEKYEINKVKASKAAYVDIVDAYR